MGYLDRSGNIGTKVGAFLAFLIVGGLVKAGFGWGMGEYQRRTFDLNQAMEQIATVQPDTYALFTSLRDLLPADYARMKATLEAKMHAGASDAEIREAAHLLMRQVTLSHRTDLSQAPSDQLARFRAIQVEAMDALKSDSEVLCAHFVTTGLQPGDRPSQRAMPFVARAAKVQVETIAAGQRARIVRPVKLSAVDAGALVDGMRALGMTQTQLELLVDQQRLNAAPPGVQCEIGGTIFRAIDTLPRDRADRITAYIVSQT